VVWIANSSFKTVGGYVARAHKAEERGRDRFLQTRPISVQEQEAAEVSITATVGRFDMLPQKAREDIQFILRHHPLRSKLLALLRKLKPEEFTGISGERTLRALCCRENERAALAFTDSLLRNLNSHMGDSVSQDRFMKAVRSVRRENHAIVPPLFLNQLVAQK